MLQRDQAEQRKQTSDARNTSSFDGVTDELQEISAVLDEIHRKDDAMNPYRSEDFAQEVNLTQENLDALEESR